MHGEPTSFFQFHLQLRKLSLLRHHLFRHFRVLLSKSLHPFRQLSQLLLRDIHLAPQLRAPLLFSDLLSSFLGSRRSFGSPPTPQEPTQELKNQVQAQPFSRGHRRKKRSKRGTRREGCVSPWGFPQPHFLELFLDAVAHAAPEPDENCSEPVQGGRGELGRAVPQRKHVFLVGQHPDRKQPGQVHSRNVP